MVVKLISFCKPTDIRSILSTRINTTTPSPKEYFGHLIPEAARKSSMSVISSTASVSTRTCFSQASLKTAMFSCAALLFGRAARVRAALTTYRKKRQKIGTILARAIDHPRCCPVHTSWIFIALLSHLGSFQEKNDLVLWFSKK